MKTLLLILLSFNLIANELQWVDEQIKAIKPPRDGIKKEKINSIKNPFIFLKKSVVANNEKKQVNTASVAKKSTQLKNKIENTTVSYSLDAIINKSALINGKWYKLDDKVGRYTLSNISATSVILSHNKKDLPLSIHRPSTKLKFKNN